MTEPTNPAGINYPQGTFCWIDLAATDVAGSKAFYTELLGWTADDIPLGNGEFYTMFKLHGKNVAGAGPMPPAQREQGMPSYWTTYLKVDDADAIAAQAQAAGGTLLAPPFDVMEEGRMSIIQDPAGAVFGIWQPRNHTGAQIANVPGAVVWNELMTRDPETAGRFYQQVFGWVTRAESDPTNDQPYIMYMQGDLTAAGMLEIGPGLDEVPPNWSIYLGVEDFDAAIAKAKSLGATPLMEPADSPYGRLVAIRDPQGAVVNIIGIGAG